MVLAPKGFYNILQGCSSLCPKNGGAGTWLHSIFISCWLWFPEVALPHWAEWPAHEEALRFHAFPPSNLSLYQYLLSSLCSSSLKSMSVLKRRFS